MKSTLLFFLVLLIPGILATSAHAQQTQVVTVSITVQTEAELPLENVPLEANSPTENRFGFTGIDGVLTTPLEITEGDDFIGVWLHSGFRYESTEIDVALADEMYRLYREQYFFRKWYFIPVVPGQNAYSLTITAHPIIHLTGNVLPPGPQEQWYPNSVFIEIRDGLWFRTVDPVNEFTIPVRQGADTELFISIDDSPRLYSVPLTTAQTINDVNIGQIVIPALQTDATAQIIMQNGKGEWFPGGVGPLWLGITLISDDGSIILSYLARHDDGYVVGNPDSAVDPNMPPDLPAATYYVAPGVVSSSDHNIHMLLLDAIRAGQLAQLDAAGVPKFTAIAGQTTNFTFDAAQARDAILAATGQGP
jgi:hypothetical protein